MKLLATTAVLSGLSLAAAQNGGSSSPSFTASSSTASASSSSSNKIAVSSSSGALTFSPASLSVAKGETVTFTFFPRNHSVAQSAFDSPCAPLDGGFFSGFHPVSSGVDAKEQPTFTVTVEDDTKPMWFYCSQGEHCQGGMVGVLNPPKTGANTLAAYKKAAAGATTNKSPSGGATGGKVGKAGDKKASASGTGAIPSGTASPSGTGTATTKIEFRQLLGLFIF
ncbi:Cupredoxin [Geopyxis carbonaria]|nr:Cupredoxin [Geopyxis carbonaria]